MSAKCNKPDNVKVLSLAGTARPSLVSISRMHRKKAMEDRKRSAAIIGDSGFDMLLAGIIELTFSGRTKEVEKLMNSTNMIQKARLAYILGLINKTVLNDLEQIHNIRNIFAHSFKASFADTKVLKFVRKLSTAKDSEVTENNSFEFHLSARNKCMAHINDVLDKEEQELKKAQKG